MAFWQLPHTHYHVSLWYHYSGLVFATTNLKFHVHNNHLMSERYDLTYLQESWDSGSLNLSALTLYLIYVSLIVNGTTRVGYMSVICSLNFDYLWYYVVVFTMAKTTTKTNKKTHKTPNCLYKSTLEIAMAQKKRSSTIMLPNYIVLTWISS